MDNMADIKSNEANLELYSEEYPFRLPLRIKNFHDDSDYKKFIRSVERMVRNSPEYKEWRNYIVDVLGIDKCMLTNESMDEVTIDVHHHVPDLYTLITCLVNECISKENEFCSFDICTKAIELHYQNKIGYVTLLKSMHEKFHNGYLRIPMSIVRGDYEYFVNKLLPYADEDQIDAIKFKLAVKSTNLKWYVEKEDVDENESDEKNEEKLDTENISLDDLINVA